MQFYAASAQLIPLLLIGLLIDQGLDTRHQKAKIGQPGHYVIAVIGLAFLAVVGEAASLDVLLRGTNGTKWSAGAATMSVTALIIALVLVLVWEPLQVWWRTLPVAQHRHGHRGALITGISLIMITMIVAIAWAMSIVPS